MSGEAAGIGARVAEERKLRGLTQRQLAERAHVSLSLLRKVEQGTVPASPAFTSSAARALGVGPAELLGQPYHREIPSDHRVFAVVPVLRRELTAYLLPPEDDAPARPISQLADAVAEASRLRHAVDLTRLGAQLPGLLAELRIAWHQTRDSERERVFGLLAEAYYAAGQLASKLGYTDLASISVDRYEWAAERSGDELAVLVGSYQRAEELICLDDCATARRLLDDARSCIEDRLGHVDPPTLATWGNLHLKSGLAAARAGDRTGADAHLAEAKEAADRIGVDRDDYRLCFGPTNVKIWSVALAVEMLDGTEAIKRADQLTLPRSAPREHAGHHWIDLARGYLLHGDHQRALATFHQAPANRTTADSLPPPGPRNRSCSRPSRQAPHRHPHQLRRLARYHRLIPLVNRPPGFQGPARALVQTFKDPKIGLVGESTGADRGRVR
jgi:transcriptional regulator with XRE-family HTH domain